MFSTKTSWIVVISLILIGTAVSTCAKADDFTPKQGIYGTVSIGRGKFFNSVDTQNRAWAQDGFHQRYNPETPVWSLGLGYQPNDYLAFEVAFHDLGKYSQYGAWACNDDESVCGPTHYGYSESRTRGLALSALPQWGKLKVSVSTTVSNYGGKVRGLSST